MDSDEETSRRDRLQFLNIRAGEDFLVSISMFALAFQFIGLFAFIFWFGEIVNPIRNGKRMSPEMQRRLRELYKLPRRLILRQSDRDDCFVVSGLGISILIISEKVRDNPESDESRLKIEHEIGHLGRADRISAEMLGVSAILGIVAVSYPAILNGLGTLTFPDPIAAYALIAIYIVMFFVGVSRIQRIAHTREYLADSHVMGVDSQAYSAYLRRRVQRERYAKPRFWFLRWTNRLSHPTYAQRLQFQIEPLSTSGISVFVSAAVTMMVVTVSICLCFSHYAETLGVGHWAGLSDDFSKGYMLLSASLSPFVGTGLAVVAATKMLQLFRLSVGYADRRSIRLGCLCGATAGLVVAAAVGMLGSEF